MNARFYTVMGIALTSAVLACAAGTGEAARSRRAAPVSFGPERSLAGISIGRPATQVVSKYGNPSRVDASATVSQSQPGTPGAPGLEGLPQPQNFGLPAQPPGSVMGAPGGMSPGGPAELGGALGNVIGGLFGAGTQQPAPGAGFAPPGGVLPGQEAFGQAQPVVQRPITKLYYDYPTGPSLIFTVGYKGLVEQIDAFAPWPWSPARTKRGIGVGATYRQVVARYGYPQAQRSNPDGTLVMDYSERAHVAFTLLAGRVVGVSVALVE
ncbi:MAG: hypothetical protein IT209_01610 [Armatimonadetes bacterium]|nr:hypothetical protein [Armatimonadota bacterium]